MCSRHSNRCKYLILKIRGVLVTGTQNGGGEGCAHLSNKDAPLPARTPYVNGAGGVPKEIAGREWSAETIEDVNATTTVLALKHGPKMFIENYFRNGTPPLSRHHRGAGERSATALIVNGESPLLIGNGSSCCSSSDERIHNELLRHALTHHPLHHHHHSNQHHSEVQQRYLIGCYLRKQRGKDVEECIGQGNVLSSPASLNGLLKRSAPNDSYSGTPTGHHHHHHHNRQQLVAHRINEQCG
ncbi:uncharacterized protein LOC125959283 isoform X1 [Anopheles darlingi]|uniref:uncharacterized protein LOC125959283 isoform X1 n=1 Tax=Anopheles darlingi TaxID=43151 RepID=UPI0020FFFED3|nr:uncharacterized protein LOC125959283 isoform X1 [Anopheles darlingi]XP_049548066.1 uncharacterized protein LOC125959283 isoform X1 [Anopheles darlingi]